MLMTVSSVLLGLATGVLAAVLGYLYFNHVKLKKQHEAAEKELQLLRGAKDSDADALQQAEVARVEAESAMRKAQKAARDADAASEAKSTFLATMSHELRTPLNCILGLSEVLMATDPTEEQQKHLMTVRHSVDALLAIISNILDYSKIEAGKMELKPERFEMIELINEVEDIFQITAREKNITLDTRIDDDNALYVHCDRNHLRQVLINLVGNAIKFTENGSVTIALSRKKAKPKNPEEVGKLRYDIVLEVIDTGIGIPPQQKGRLFKAFDQLVDSKTRKYEGTGLGLVISKRIIDALGGRISVEDNEPRGTAFRVNLLLDGFATKPSKVAKMTKLSEPTLYKHALGEAFYSHHILVAEDNTINRIVMTAMLEKMGHKAGFVTNGAEALDYLNEHDVDLVLMDIQMPVMDGMEATEAIRAGEAGENNKDVPIVALTAFALVSDKEKYLSSGMDHYLTKPVKPELLRQVLTDLARNKESHSAG